MTGMTGMTFHDGHDGITHDHEGHDGITSITMRGVRAWTSHDGHEGRDGDGGIGLLVVTDDAGFGAVAGVKGGGEISQHADTVRSLCCCFCITPMTLLHVVQFGNNASLTSRIRSTAGLCCGILATFHAMHTLQQLPLPRFPVHVRLLPLPCKCCLLVLLLLPAPCARRGTALSSRV